MINLIKNKINQIEKERKDMSKSHHENYYRIKKNYESHRKNDEECNIKNHVEKELSRHF
ncbi:hypothetical protein [Staphylococcus hominis]|uniref:hypothetical protein n=1 Tax=Staphylococcus hominis TaxID=1290 RepID=UPI0013F17CAE|nr:hypothetical protein [Staphylococcus hominis]MCI2928239.1 hypothetical protein [Staphylococcus hominis]